MSAISSQSGAFDRGEPIPGYKTQNLLGRGGYGEVWHAIAPGGIAKAIKIVFGDVDDSQAATEMRALSRIKDVRHPLLLSIERIEIVAGNLVIVTELADHSLKERFQQLQGGHTTGIPQDELLGYVADSAEALDFLYSRYSLQHLDVKPENILLVSGRAKVGDFGLVKNLYERSASLVGGLTPTYAPPEVFEGKPSRHSDQYSLAIRYVQMLTGTLPFAATNVAQLATLHLHGVPELSVLPKRQRPVIARALSKDPEQRFESCTAMVQALRAAVTEAEPVAAPAHVQSIAPKPETHTDIENATAVCNPRFISRDNLASFPLVPAQRVTESSITPTIPVAVETEDENALCPPTILVGVGGAGVAVLSKLVHRLRDRFGNSENWPPIEFLLLDTNTKDLAAPFRDAELARINILPIPLKAADDYGNQAGGLLKWLGRRWLYNIPRDRTTGGFRPLGRLALMTHAPRVREAISAVTTRAVGRTGGGRAPRVVLVGSISGGTGSGAILDLAYAVRGELKRRGLSDEQVHGLLLHATPRSNADRDKARATAYATLSEMHHFSRPGSHYPGEPALGAPPFHGDNHTFGHTHLLHLGDGLGESEWDLATDQIAEFVYGTTLTPARLILDEVQRAETGVAAESTWPFVQSYEVLTLGAGSGPTVAQAVRRACNDVIRLWREGRRAEIEPGSASRSDRTALMNVLATASGPRAAQAEAAVKQKLVSGQLDFESFLADATEVVKLEVGSDAESLVCRLVDEALSKTQDNHAGTTRTDAMFAMIDPFLHCDTDGGAHQQDCGPLYSQVVGRLIVRTRGRVQELVDWLRNHVDSQDLRIEGARQRATAAQKILQSIQEKALTQATELREAALAISLDALATEAQKGERSRFSWSLRRENPDQKLREVLQSYTRTRLNELLCRSIRKIMRIVDAEISTLIEHMDRLARDLHQLVDTGDVSQAGREEAADAASSSSGTLVDCRQMMLAQLTSRRRDIAESIDAALERRLFKGEQGLRKFLAPEAQMWTLRQPLAEAARQAVLDCIREIGCQLIEACGTAGQHGSASDLVASLWNGLAGTQEVARADVIERVVMVPDDVEVSSLRNRFRATLPNTTIIAGKKCDITLWRIRRPTAIEQVATDIIGGNEQFRDLAQRLHARVDIQWRAFSASDPTNGNPAEDLQAAGMPLRTEVLPIH